MLRWTRRQVPVLLAVALVGASFVAAAQVVISTVPTPVAVTFPEVKVFVYVTLAVVLSTVVVLAGSVAAFVLHIGRAADAEGRAALAAAIVADHKVREEQFAGVRGSVESVDNSVKELTETIKEHIKSPFPHPAATHAETKALEERMAALKAEMDGHAAYCCTHGRALGQRDPADSPHPCRFTDSAEFNAAELNLRGPKP